MSLKIKSNLTENDLKVYSYSDILEITQNGISLKDGTYIDFNVCFKNAREYFNKDITFCVAERKSDATPPFFEFFSDTRIKIQFNEHKGLFAKNKNLREFQHLQDVLQAMNISSYDLS